MQHFIHERTLPISDGLLCLFSKYIRVLHSITSTIELITQANKKSSDKVIDDLAFYVK